MTATPDSTAPQDSAPTPDDAAPVLGEQGRPEPPQAGDETATLRGFLDFQRATFAWRTDGLDAEGLRRRLIVHQQARPESMDEARQIYLEAGIDAESRPAARMAATDSAGKRASRSTAI